MTTPARRKPAAKTGTTKNEKVISLSDYIQQQSGYDPEAQVVDYLKAEVFGIEFRVATGGLNIFNTLSIGDADDTAAIIQALLRMIHPDDRATFRSGIAQLPNFDAEAFVPFITGLISIAAEGKAPTSSEGSRRTTRAKAALPPSAAD